MRYCPSSSSANGAWTRPCLLIVALCLLASWPTLAQTSDSVTLAGHVPLKVQKGAAPPVGRLARASQNCGLTRRMQPYCARKRRRSVRAAPSDTREPGRESRPLQPHRRSAGSCSSSKPPRQHFQARPIMLQARDFQSGDLSFVVPTAEPHRIALKRLLLKRLHFFGTHGTALQLQALE